MARQGEGFLDSQGPSFAATRLSVWIRRSS